MFDMGFLELLVIVVIGLLVIGPERLPGAIKTGVIWVNGIRRNITAARTEFERQIGADEIRREIHNEQVLATLREAKRKQDELRKQVASQLEFDESNGNHTEEPIEHEPIDAAEEPTDDNAAAENSIHSEPSQQPHSNS